MQRQRDRETEGGVGRDKNEDSRSYDPFNRDGTHQQWQRVGSGDMWLTEWSARLPRERGTGTTKTQSMGLLIYDSRPGWNSWMGA